jgi:hypothetical protein
MIFVAALACIFTPAWGKPVSKSDGKGVVEEDVDAAKLWAQNCSRCHNLRPAKSFSDAQWDVIVHHMRVRGNLTGQEARAIGAFLKEAN